MSKKIAKIFKFIHALRTFDELKDGETVHALNLDPPGSKPISYFTLRYSSKVFDKCKEEERTNYAFQRNNILYGTSKFAIMLTIYYKYLR